MPVNLPYLINPKFHFPLNRYKWNNTPSSPTTITNNYITSVLEDNEGNILIGTYLGLNIFNYEKSKSKFKHIYSDKNNPGSLSNSLIWSLTKSEFDSNLIWIGTADGLTGYYSDKQTFFRVNIPNPQNIQFGTAAGNVIEEMIGNEKILWIDSYAGLIRLNTANGNATRYLAKQNNPDYLISSYINKITRDRSGVTWICTENGLSYFSSKSSKFNNIYAEKNNILGLNELKGKNITTIAQTLNGTLWFGTSDGLYYSEKVNDYKIIKKHSRFSDIHIWSLCGDNSGNLWVGTYGSGLYQLDVNKNQVKKKLLIDPKLRTQSVNFIKSLLTDDDNNLWIGFWGLGLAKLDLITDELKVWMNNVDTDKYSISHNDVWSIFQDSKKRLWIGTNGGGLNLFVESDGGKFLRWISDTNEPNSLSSNSINSIIESAKTSNDDQTVLWLSTTNGLNKIMVTNAAYVSDSIFAKVDISSYLIQEGNSNNSFNSILEDANGNLWLGTSTGLTFFDVVEEKFINFTKADGIVGGNFNTNSAFKDGNGILYFGSTSGLNYFDHDQIKLSTYEAPIVLTDFKIFNESVSIGDDSPLVSSITNTKEIVLSYNQNVFSIEFASLDFNSPHSIEYAYKMEGFDIDWVYSGKRRLATYTNLDPGNYTFKVKSTNADGVWNNNVKSVSFIIEPPFWMTWWFRGVIILLFLSTGPIIYYRRVKQLKKEKQLQMDFSRQLIQSQEEERKRIASELHDSIGQDLLVIKNLALLNKNKDDQFNEISKIAGDTIDDVRRISYNLHPYQLDRLGLTKAIQSMFVNIENATKIKFDLNIDNIDGLVSKEKEISIFRIIQECVNNVIKHSEATKTNMMIKFREDNLIIEISDNGKGFNFETAKSEAKGFGLKNLENRVNLLGGNIAFSSSTDYKTEIKINIPITK